MTTIQSIVGLSVQTACEKITKERSGNVGAGEWFTLSELAKVTGLSKPTARKYVNMLVDAGLVIRAWYGGNDTASYVWGGE